MQKNIFQVVCFLIPAFPFPNTIISVCDFSSVWTKIILLVACLATCIIFLIWTVIMFIKCLTIGFNSHSVKKLIVTALTSIVAGLAAIALFNYLLKLPLKMLHRKLMPIFDIKDLRREFLELRQNVIIIMKSIGYLQNRYLQIMTILP